MIKNNGYPVGDQAYPFTPGAPLSCRARPRPGIPHLGTIHFYMAPPSAPMASISVFADFPKGKTRMVADAG
jgi:hypothetical protein